MFKNIKTQIALIFCISLLMVSCLEDEGNYAYTEVDEITFEGVEEYYSIARYDDFKVTPGLKHTKDSNNYTYKWFINDGGYDSEVIAETKDLDIEKLDWAPGKHDIYYVVTDEDTEIEYEYRFKVEVLNPFYEGWLVLSEENGGSRLDMISYLFEEYIVKNDVLSIANSELELSGVPESLMIYQWDRRVLGIYITTSGNGTVRLTPNTFETSRALSSEFASDQPADLKADNLVSPYPNYGYAAANGNIYHWFSVWHIRYNLPINIIDGVPFEASPYIVKGAPFSTTGYDDTNKRFVTFSGFQARSGEMAPEASTLFDYNTGKDLIYMTQSRYNGTRAFAFLKDPLDSKHYLAIFSPNKYTQYYYGEITATDFDMATSYAVSPDFGYIFYAVGGKVYQYDFTQDKTTLMLDRAEEVTHIKFNEFSKSSDRYDLIGSQLVVCTYNGSANGGVVELYDVPPVNGQITLESSYSGFGKIKGIGYRDR